MNGPRFADLHDESDLAKAVGVPAARILDYARAPSQAAFYQAIQIPKRHRRRRGQFRVVHKARHDWLAQLHRMIAILVGRHVAWPECVQGFVDRRSIATNAAQHLGARIVLHGDLAGFFDAITTEQVRLAFVALGCAEPMAELLARASTIDGFLRQGTRVSPAIANLVCRQLDVDLQTLANAHGARYTRYADDLTFSGDDVPSSAEVAALVARHGFALRDGRCHAQSRGRGQYVTGLTVSDPSGPRLPRRMKRRMRLVLHFVEKFGVDDHFAHAGPRRGFADQRQLEGALRFFHAIEPALTRRLRERFRRGLEKSKSRR